MAEGRDPLGSVSTNVSLPSTPSPPKQLYPIFLPQSQTRVRSAIDNSTPARPKRTKNTEPTCLSSEDRTSSIKRQRSSHDLDDNAASSRPRHPRTDSTAPNRLSSYFPPTVPLRVALSLKSPKPHVPEAPSVSTTHPQMWRRARKRFGQGRSGDGAADRNGDYLSSLVTCLSPSPAGPPSTIMIPSIHSPSHERDLDPALVAVFSNSARMYKADEARDLGRTRMLAIASEEGAVRIVDIDRPPEAIAPGGLWWRAHENGIFDLKWTPNDERLISSSADQTARLFDIASGSPRVLATLRGHTSSIKSSVFLDAGRGSNPVHDTNIVASGGRDGNINIYDLRCRGVHREDDDPDGRRRSNRTRQSNTAPGPSEIDGHNIHPVMVLRQPHNSTSGRRANNSSRSVTRSITSLVALQTMPGILASGGSSDGVVKLWDIRCPDSSSSLRPRATSFCDLPDPTVAGTVRSTRPRSINAMCEQTATGDLYILCGDSNIHIIRPSAAKQAVADPAEAILRQKFVHPDLLTRSFDIRMSLSPCGQYLACGSSHAGVMMWDTSRVRTSCAGDIVAQRLRIPSYGRHTPEVFAVDWASDALAASSDDSVTRIWRSNFEQASSLRTQPPSVAPMWSGTS